MVELVEAPDGGLPLANPKVSHTRSREPLINVPFVA